MIDDLRLKAFRCFEDRHLEFSPGLNCFHGDNGSGKTSLLECLYLLGRGRSFRTRLPSDLVHYDHPDALVSVKGNLNDLPFFIATSISKNITFKLNREPLSRRSDLIDLFPLQLATPLSHKIIDSSPEHRRKFLDWGLFHVEQMYRQVWRDFQRCLLQRNHALKSQSGRVDIWDYDFIKLSLQLESYRLDYIKQLKPYLSDIISTLLPGQAVSIELHSGWSNKSSIETQLADARSKDQKLGYTTLGPHKADIRFSFGNSKRNNLSRGQQKLLVYGLLIAQCMHFYSITEKSPSLLLDDIGSELDNGSLVNVVELVASTGFQSFITSIDKFPSGTVASIQWFHVEHNK